MRKIELCYNCEYFEVQDFEKLGLVGEKFGFRCGLYCRENYWGEVACKPEYYVLREIPKKCLSWELVICNQKLK